MPLWDNKTKKPQDLSRQEKRNVIVTPLGYVRRQTYRDVHGNIRVKDELLVSAQSASNSSNFGTARIEDMWHSTAISAVNVPVQTNISFTEPVTSTSSLKLTASSGGNTVTATANTSVSGAQNTLTFTWTPTVAGTYKFEAQTAANATATATNVRSANPGAEAASLIISGVVSNTASVVVIS